MDPRSSSSSPDTAAVTECSLLPETWRARLDERLTALAGWVERRAWWLLAAVLAMFVLAMLCEDHGLALWHDELFTYYIAQAPNLHVLVQQVHDLEFNPVLPFLLVRWCFHLFGVGPMVTRLPFLGVFTVGLGCAFCWTRRRVGALWGLVGVLALIANDGKYTRDARPYALLIGFLLVVLLGMDLAEEPGGRRGVRRMGLVLLGAGGAGLMLSHAAGLPLLVLLLGSKLLGDWRRRQDWAALAAMALPLPLVLVDAGLSHNHGASLFPAEYVPTISTLVDLYGDAVSLLQPLLLPAVILVAVLLGARTFGARGRWPVRRSQGLYLTAWLMFPAALIFYFMHAHAAFFTRYGFTASVALAVLLPVVLGWMMGSRSAGAMLVLLVVAGANVRLPYHAAEALRPVSWRVQAEGPTKFSAEMEAISPGLPLVVSSGLSFVEMNARETDQLLARTYFLQDRAAALRIAHATIFTGMERERAAFHLRGQVEDYGKFVAEHPCFLVFGTYTAGEDWVLPKLKEDGATLTLAASLPEVEYYHQNVWLVRAPGAKAGCELR